MSQWIIENTVDGALWSNAVRWVEDLESCDKFSEQQHQELNLPFEGQWRERTPLEIARQNSLAAFSTKALETAVRNLERRGDLFCKLRPNGELAWCHRDYKRVTQ